ncbi:flavin reductase family protein [Sphingomonas hengshuiensis]|uniref:flavin reductase family protein n=1 Tax=Sphingomonas hengshuiensis TaxID=1609977 RepID=UPI0009820D7C|nr:flavin reductase family protein [Sphingomonas hengshuiensis]
MTILRDIDDDSDLRQLFGRFPTGVTALCAMNGDQPIGMTASAFVAISLNPALVSVCIKHESWTWQQLRGCDRIGISFLGHGHAAVARQLAQRSDDRFRGLDYDVTTNGALFLAGATAWLECALEQEIPAGDHDIVLFRLHRASLANSVMPLVFHCSDFHTLTPVNQMRCPAPSSGLKVGTHVSVACADR